MSRPRNGEPSCPRCRRGFESVLEFPEVEVALVRLLTGDVPEPARRASSALAALEGNRVPTASLPLAASDWRETLEGAHSLRLQDRSYAPAAPGQEREVELVVTEEEGGCISTIETVARVAVARLRGFTAGVEALPVRPTTAELLALGRWGGRDELLFGRVLRWMPAAWGRPEDLDAFPGVRRSEEDGALVAEVACTLDLFRAFIAPRPLGEPPHLAQFLVLGAPEGKRELLDGGMPHVIACASEEDARRVFEALRAQVAALPAASRPGDLRLEREGTLVELRLQVRPEVFEAFAPMNYLIPSEAQLYGRVMSRLGMKVDERPGAYTVGRVGVVAPEREVAMAPDFVVYEAGAPVAEEKDVLIGPPDVVMDFERGPSCPRIERERARGYAALGAREWWRLRGDDERPLADAARDGRWEPLETECGKLSSRALPWLGLDLGRARGGAP